jgi:hypothetical protein
MRAAASFFNFARDSDVHIPRRQTNWNDAVFTQDSAMDR